MLRKDADYIIENSIKAVLPDAAGGYVDGQTMRKLQEKGIDIVDVLGRNDSYNALQSIDGLIITGATGTNVNDVAVVLIR